MNKRKKLVSILAGVMAIIMLLTLLLSLIPTEVFAASSSEIRDQINALESEKEALQEKMDALDQQRDDNLSEIQQLLDQKLLIDQEIGLLHAQISNINEQIAAYSLLIADKQDELDAAQARHQELTAKNKDRIRAMEEDGGLSYWSVLFKANSFSDLLDRLSMIEEIAAADQRRLEELSQAAQEVKTAREELSTEKTSLESTKAELDESQAVLDEKRAEADELITLLLARGEELSALMDDMEEQEESLLSEIAAQEQEYNEAKQREYEQWLSTSIPDPTEEEDEDEDEDEEYFIGGDWIVPCSYVYVSSPFSPNRLHPVLGYVTAHQGIDLAAYQGTPIYASRGGTVTSATYNESGGYYVTINHGDGFSSTYLHMTHYVVSRGEYVSQGELIGYVGSTGYSTGPHLHFGIFLNGVAVNPANYIAF